MNSMKDTAADQTIYQSTFKLDFDFIYLVFFREFPGLICAWKISRLALNTIDMRANRLLGYHRNGQ